MFNAKSWMSVTSYAWPGALLAVVLLAGCDRTESPPAADAPARRAADAQPQQQPADDPRPAPILTLTEADGDRAVKLQRGQVVEIRLPADRAGGFSWIPARNALPVLDTNGLPQFEADASGAPNAPGTEVWQFIGREAGHAHLEFEYRKPAEPDASPRQTISYHFDVE